MYGEKASELIRHITRDDHEIMPEYKHELVEQVLKENDELYNENLKASQSNTGNQDENVDIGEKELMVMQVRHTAKLWNKRCIIAYHYERLNRLKKLRWDYGNNLPREIVEKLSKTELEWFTTYNNNLFSYMSALNDGKGLDLTLYSTPPKKLFIQVKCVRDYGQFDLEDGQPVMLKKDSIHYLPLSQCEKLIHQGVLEQTSL
jgi:GINS complex subunit 1